jgi:membrane fusion protein (multidrug efflux system)
MRSVVSITTVISLASAAVLLSACSKPAGMGPPPAQGTPQVGVMTVQPQTVTINTELPGRTAPVLIAEVRPQVTGLVRSRNFVEGSEVKAGEVLYEIDPSTYRASADSAQGALAKAQANLQSTRLKAERLQGAR